MAPLPRRTGPNRLMDRIDAGLDPSGTTKRSPAMANAPALTGRGPMPLSNAASQKAYAPGPAGLDNNMRRAPFTAPPYVQRRVPLQPYDPNDSGVRGSGGIMPNTAGAIENAGRRAMAQIELDNRPVPDLGKPNAFGYDPNNPPQGLSPLGLGLSMAWNQYQQANAKVPDVMPRNLSPADQEAWGRAKERERAAAAQSDVNNIITGGGWYALDRNTGMPISNGQGQPLPNTVTGAYGRSGAPVYRPDGSRWVDPVGGADAQAAHQYSLSPAQQSLRDEMQRRYDKAQMDRDQKLAATFAPGFQRPQAQLDRMRQQRADSSNPKWEAARQERIAAHKAKRELITAKAVEDANNRQARLTARKGYLAETAFQNMSPEQQLSYMTGGRSNAGNNPAQDEYYRAQAETLRAQAKNAERMGGAMAGGTTPGAPAGSEAPAPSPYAGSPKAKLGIPEGEENMAKGLVRSGADTSNPETRRMLTDWAKSDPEDEYKGLLHMRIFGNPNPDVLMNNQLRIEIRRGNWNAVDQLLKNASTQTKPSAPAASSGPDLGGLGSGGGLGSMGGVM